MTTGLALALPALATAALIAALRSMSWPVARLSDHPNERSLHVHPTPRVGGLAMMLCTLPLIAWLAPPLLAIVAAAAALAVVSLADDLRSLPVAIRLGAHFAAAAVAVAMAWANAPLGIPLALAWIMALAWMTNLFNFMDGADGLAGGMAAIGFGAFALAAREAQSVDLFLACAAIASANVGFLAFNFPPAKVFLGDTGSIPLGFLAAALALRGVQVGAWTAAFALLVFLPFIADATATIAKRAFRGERLWRAHREHYYQRLVLSGWSRRRLVLAAYALMAATCASALALRSQDAELQWVILGAWSVVFVLSFIAMDARFVKRVSTPTREPP